MLYLELGRGTSGVLAIFGGFELVDMALGL